MESKYKCELTSATNTKIRTDAGTNPQLATYAHECVCVCVCIYTHAYMLYVDILRAVAAHRYLCEHTPVIHSIPDALRKL